MLTENRKEQIMFEIEELAVRELDHRNSDGIDVRLLWNSITNKISIAVSDSHDESSFELAVEGADALEAFRHPYAFAC